MENQASRPRCLLAWLLFFRFEAWFSVGSAPLFYRYQHTSRAVFDTVFRIIQNICPIGMLRCIHNVIDYRVVFFF
ncbi:hypothetical protein AK821_02415 [Pseudomonas sp. RIT-PI-r]|nr:hypothetical protein AK821_02415 [Pseudomonas sp. RIT-PI-r]